jgi:hypothetical protein
MNVHIFVLGWWVGGFGFVFWLGFGIGCLGWGVWL